MDVVASAPLVSIDLIVRDDKRQVLLGKRTHRPAKGYWFVPGGSIRKNERILDAIERISRIEIGHSLELVNISR